MTVAINMGPDTHLDHLAPLCALLNIPLIITNEDHFKIGKDCYPMIETQYIPLAELTLEYIAKHFNTILTCGKFWVMELKPMLKLFFNKDIHLVFVPHGNSDKESFLKASIEQDIDLVYGPQMLSFKKGSRILETGNLRFWFYQKHKTHFDRLAKKYFIPKDKTILYAPTWESKATSTSFFDRTDELVNTFANDHHLVIKLHPLLEENDPVQFYRILGKYENVVTFIEKFPPIYPLLEKTDIYIGDYSSVGYDFLLYDRPMFFLKNGGTLNQCGETFKGSIENPQKELSLIRQKIYKQAFGIKCFPEKVKSSLLKILSEKN